MRFRLQCASITEGLTGRDNETAYTYHFKPEMTFGSAVKRIGAGIDITCVEKEKFEVGKYYEMEIR